jgi:hypothetical protein
MIRRFAGRRDNTMNHKRRDKGLVGLAAGDAGEVNTAYAVLQMNSLTATSSGPPSYALSAPLPGDGVAAANDGGDCQYLRRQLILSARINHYRMAP